jgi:hypothetical protein
MITLSIQTSIKKHERLCKIIFILFFCLLPTLSFALPCPSGTGILYKGDSIDEVIKQCGKPAITKSNTQVISTSEKLVYYISYSPDYGYIKLEVFAKNDVVTGLRVTEHTPIYYCRTGAVLIGPLTTFQTSCGDWIYNPTSSNLCRGWINVGDKTQRILDQCGKPDENDSQSNTIITTELIYEGKNSQTIVFQNGKLVDWK